jgi:antitoxin (DNA-binding transcriptional repressor) of toxin-antitoxin stability system
MIRLNIHEAKTHLSRFLSRLKPGQVIILCRRNIPIAEIRPLKSTRTRPRRLGVAQGEFSVPPSFFEPLPEDLVRGFQGEG